MKLTPLDIRKQEFKKTLRGYDPIEVQTFLDMVAEEFETLQEESKRLNRRVVELETKLKDYQETEKNLRETLLNVQEVKKQSEEHSRRQADLIIKEAELKALEIVETARKQARQMRDEVNLLRTQKESFINRLRQILVSQIELLSVLEMDDAIPEEAHVYVEKARKRKKASLKNWVEKQKVVEEESPDSEEDQAAIELEEEVKEELPVTEEFASEVEAEEEVEEEEFQVSQQTTDEEQVEKKQPKKKMEDEDNNEYFKRDIQINELIQKLEKKREKNTGLLKNSENEKKETAVSVSIRLEIHF